MLRNRMGARVEAAREGLPVWLGLCMSTLIVYALSRHVSVEDALASMCAFLLLLRAIRKRGDA